ncbi:Rv1355c family protein [Dyadobacter sp. 3J3]|uniref:Rv1355c family protein n=1 Tax=Dyadobacter sp. 3J3 TaxID=2606600 RepID=UPI001356B9CA|nr:Rv1355c family protein [Dyadobacter sp. 3J3]
MDKIEFAQIFLPVIFKLTQSADKEKFNEIISDTNITILDLFRSQKGELYKIRSPQKRVNAADCQYLFEDWIKNKVPDEEGVWVYYPWAKRILHILEEDEFIEVRTSRNKHKITTGEQNALFNKKIGIVGLSVGNAVALTLATERICGHIKLADFDTLELSNMNRIKTGLHNIGINKAIITAREIAEIDPFIKVECYLDGITEENISGFLTDNGNLNLLLEECDELDIKVLCRNEAKKHGIPVVMETSDKGMLDVERFDLEPDRPIFHGLIGNIDPSKLKNLTNEEKVPLIIRIVDAKNSSLRGRVSLLEVGQSIGTWPQLASAVTLGAGVTTDVVRRILLNQFHDSGRYYVDSEGLISNKNVNDNPTFSNPFPPFDITTSKEMASRFDDQPAKYIPDLKTIEKLVKAACQAPSTGNDQPWKWLYQNGKLFLFHDEHRAYSFGNFDNIASNLSFGAAFENLILKSNEAGLFIKKNLYPIGSSSQLVAVIEFSQTKEDGFEKVFSPESVHVIYDRTTNRNPSQPVEIPETELKLLTEAAESVDGAELLIIRDKEQMRQIAEIIGGCDRIRLLNEEGHKDFVFREMKWTKEEAEKSADGIDVQTLGMSPAQLAAMSLIKDHKIARVLKQIDGGHALIDVSRKLIESASALGIITLPEYNAENFFNGGISLERLWLKAELLGYAIHPLISPFYLFPRIVHGQNAGVDQKESEKLHELRQKFLKLVPLKDDMAEVFMFKIAKAEAPTVKSLRLHLHDTFFAGDKTNK